MSKKSAAKHLVEAEEAEETEGVMEFDFGEKWMNVNAYPDFMKTLPPNIKKRVNALQVLDADVKTVKADAERELKKLTAEYYAKMAPLLAARKALVTGESEPSEEDVVKGVAAAQEKADKQDKEGGAVASATEEGDDVDADEKKEAKAGHKGLKAFWLRVLQHHVVISSFIEGHDEPALELLEDITIEPLPDQGPTGGDFRVNFHFPANNAFFENAVLSKTFKMKTELDEECLDKAESTEIKWKPGKNLTKKLVKKVQKKKGKGKNTETRTITKEEDCPSFFRFFLDNEEEEGEQEEWLMLARVLMVKVVPKAVEYYTGEGPDGSSDMEEDDDDAWDMPSEEDEEDEPPMLMGKGGRGGYSGGDTRGKGKGGRGGGGQQQECKQQ